MEVLQKKKDTKLNEQTAKAKFMATVPGITVMLQNQQPWVCTVPCQSYEKYKACDKLFCTQQKANITDGYHLALAVVCWWQ